MMQRFPVSNFVKGPSLGQRNPWDWLPPTPAVPPGAPPSIHQKAAECEALRRKYGSYPRGSFILTSVEQDIEQLEQDRMNAYYDWWICEGKLKKMIEEWNRSPKPAVPSMPSLPSIPSLPPTPTPIPTATPRPTTARQFFVDESGVVPLRPPVQTPAVPSRAAQPAPAVPAATESMRTDIPTGGAVPTPGGANACYQCGGRITWGPGGPGCFRTNYDEATCRGLMQGSGSELPGLPGNIATSAGAPLQMPTPATSFASLGRAFLPQVRLREVGRI